MPTTVEVFVATVSLLAHLFEPLDLGSLEIDAIPIDEPAPAEGLVVHRRDHQLLVRGLN